MISKNPNGKEVGDGRMLVLAKRNLERVLDELDATLAELEARAEGAGPKAKAASVDVRKAIQVVFEERHRIEKLTEKDSGGSGGGLDLDAAREEIRRRIARIRERGGG
ncbi:MAG: hypothetical protein CR993_01735 [Rhodobacterales bacterium]|nr:MAG: hypothetical protein CR993_01735 [Rhodobacterales bacterium]